jgi:uncharacterized membrane protein YgcG
MKPGRRILLVAALFCTAASLFAEPISQLHPSNYVNDFAHVLSAGTESSLNALCKQIDEKAHAQLIFIRPGASAVSRRIAASSLSTQSKITNIGRP